MDEYSASYPRWGIVAAGVLGLQQMWVLRTDVTECSSSHDAQAAEQEGWPTPRQAATRSSRASVTRQGHWSAPALEQMAELAQGEIPREYQEEAELTPQARRVYEAAHEMWPTPTADDSKNARNATARRTEGSRHHSGTTLVDATWPQENWATPRASCHDIDTLERSRYSGSRLKQMKQAGQPYQTRTSGMLNPRWVCLMMALPPDYLAIAPDPKVKAKARIKKRR